MAQQKFVIVTPGRVAFTTAAAREQFSSTPKAVIWTPYLEELLSVHGDIQVVASPAQLLREQQQAAAEKIKDNASKDLGNRARAPAPEAKEAPADVARDPR